MTTAAAALMPVERPGVARARDTLKRAGNPFRNYFARNPDDDVCSRYHVPELFSAERDLLHAVIDLYRYDPMTRSEVLPVLGNKGAGKTHLLHSIKHGGGGQWQLLVTPGTYQKDSEFLEYLLFQIIDTLLGGGKQKGQRPIEFVGEMFVRRQLSVALRELSPEDRLDLFPPIGLARWGRRFGMGAMQANERAESLIEMLSGHANFARQPVPLRQALQEGGMSPERAYALIAAHTERSEAHNAGGRMRRHVMQGFARAALMGDEAELAGFLTYGFAELDFHVRPSRQELVLSLFKVLTDVFRGLKIPVVVAFDQLEDLLLSRRSDDAHRIAEAFFAGIVQVMHQIDGLCFLVFAERGLWNRFIPSLDGYIQDRLNNPVHVPKLGTVKIIRLEAPPADLVRRVVEARLRPVLDEIPGGLALSDIYPFTDEQIDRIARTEPTLRDMLQQFRHLFDHMVYGPEDALPDPKQSRVEQANWMVPLPQLLEPSSQVPALLSSSTAPLVATNRMEGAYPGGSLIPAMQEGANNDFHRTMTPTDKQHRIAALLGQHDDSPTVDNVQFKHVDVIEMPPTEVHVDEVPLSAVPSRPEHVEQQEPVDLLAAAGPSLAPSPQLTPPPTAVPMQQVLNEQVVEPTPAEVVEPAARVSIALSESTLAELWDQEFRAARRKLEPEGALTGATRELQAALGAFLATCHEHGVKVGPWRLQHVVPEWPFGEHPTYGVVSLAHWACKDSQPWKVGVGLFLARGPGKPKDLEIKLAVMDTQPQMVDHLILLRPEDDMTVTGKSKQVWQEAEKKGKHARLEAVSLDGFAQLYSFPRWLSTIREGLPASVPLPNLADIIQEKAEKLLEQVCMPVQG